MVFLTVLHYEKISFACNFVFFIILTNHSKMAWNVYVLTFFSFNFLFFSLQFDEFLFCIIEFLKPVVVSANMGSTRSNFVVFETDETNC